MRCNGKSEFLLCRERLQLEAGAKEFGHFEFVPGGPRDPMRPARPMPGNHPSTEGYMGKGMGYTIDQSCAAVGATHHRETPMSFDGSSPPPMLPVRGYFAIGAERISKSLNLGNIMRSAHAFGASFTFTVGASYQALEARADTSKGQWHLPHYNWGSLDEMKFPLGCELVGVELTDDAVELTRFRHPLRAAYVLGPERGSLSPELIARCDHIVRIPTRFCVNVAIAAAIVMYDRVRAGSVAPRLP